MPMMTFGICELYSFVETIETSPPRSRATVTSPGVQVTGPWVFDREALVEALARVAGNEARITDMIGLCDVAQMRVRALPAQ